MSAAAHTTTSAATSALRSAAAILAGLASAAGVLVLPAVLAAEGRVEAASIVHVSTAGSDSSDGSSNAPVRTVKRAVQLAKAGDTVQIRSGTYHEEVQVYAKQVHLEAAPGADVVFDGARPVTGWGRVNNGWAAQWNTDFSRAGAPHTTTERPEAGWPEQFFIDGAELVEVTSSAAVLPGTFFHDRSSGRVIIGSDPTGRLVEGSDLAWAVYLNKAHGSSLSDVTVRRYATPTTNMAAVRAYANDLRIADVTIEDNAYMGVSVIGINIELSGIVTQNNGHLGAHAHSTTGLTVTNAVIADNNTEQFDPFHAAGGIKMTDSSGIRIVDSEVTGNAGPGIWTDLDSTDIVLTGNTVTGNSRSGIELELSARAIVANNVVTGNGESGVWVLETSDVQIWHNAIFDNVRDLWVEDGPRSDVDRVDVVNNTMGGIGRGGPAIVNVDDWTSDRSAEEMQVNLSTNRYWMPVESTTVQLSRWADWPYGVRLSDDLDEHRATTSQDHDAQFSRSPVNPYTRSTTDFRAPTRSATGQPLTDTIVAVLSIPSGSYAPGLISRPNTPDMPSPDTTSSQPPTPGTTHPDTTTTTATSADTTTTTPAPVTSSNGNDPTQMNGPFGNAAAAGLNGALQHAVRGAVQQRIITRAGFFESVRQLIAS